MRKQSNQSSIKKFTENQQQASKSPNMRPCTENQQQASPCPDMWTSYCKSEIRLSSKIMPNLANSSKIKQNHAKPSKFKLNMQDQTSVVAVVVAIVVAVVVAIVVAVVVAVVVVAVAKWHRRRRRRRRHRRCRRRPLRRREVAVVVAVVVVPVVASRSPLSRARLPEPGLRTYGEVRCRGGRSSEAEGGARLIQGYPRAVISNARPPDDASRRARPWEPSKKWGGSETSPPRTPARGGPGERNAARFFPGPLAFFSILEESAKHPGKPGNWQGLRLQSCRPHFAGKSAAGHLAACQACRRPACFCPQAPAKRAVFYFRGILQDWDLILEPAPKIAGGLTAPLAARNWWPGWPPRRGAAG